MVSIASFKFSATHNDVNFLNYGLVDFKIGDKAEGVLGRGYDVIDSSRPVNHDRGLAKLIRGTSTSFWSLASFLRSDFDTLVA